MKFWAWFVGIMVFLFLLSCLGIHVLPWDAVFALVAGWILFIARTLPKVQWSGGMVLSAAVYVVLLGVGGQLFLRWLYSQTSGARWRVGWTLRAFAVLLLMFVAGTAAFGVVQHVKTLAGSQEIFIPYMEHSDRRYCAENLTDIGQALMRYARDHRGRFPPDLPSLIRRTDLNPYLLLCPATDLRKAYAPTREEKALSVLRPEHCSYVYLGKGLSASDRADIVVMYERIDNHDQRGMHLLFGNGRVEWFSLGEAQRKLEESVEIVRKMRD